MYDIEDYPKDDENSHQEDTSSEEQGEIEIKETVDQFTVRKDEEKLKQWRSE